MKHAQIATGSSGRRIAAAEPDLFTLFR